MLLKAWIVDRWLRKDAPASVRRMLNASRSVQRAGERIPDRYKSARFGQGKRWLVQWFEIDGGGKRVKRGRTFDDKGAAERYVSSVSNDQLSGRYVNTEDRKRLYGDVWREWFSGKHQVKDSTLNRYQREYDTYVGPRWANVEVGAIDSVAVNEWIGQLRDGTAIHAFETEREPKPLSASSVRSIVAITFGSALRYAADPVRRLIPFNPLASVALPRDNRPDDPVYLRYEEVEALADVCDFQNALLIRMLAYTGMRPSEMLALHVDALDFERRRIRVVRNFTEDRDGHIVEGSPKTWETRTVAMPKFLLDDLHTQCSGRELDDYVFTSSRGKALNLANWRNREWRNIVLGSGVEIDGLTIYSLRHTYASLAIAAGCDVKTLQRAMGHKDASVTLNTYATLFPDRLDEVADALDKRRVSAVVASECIPNTHIRI